MNGEAVDYHVEYHIFEGDAGVGNKLSNNEIVGIKREDRDIESVEGALNWERQKQRELYSQLIDQGTHKEVEYQDGEGV